jgi:hypothetical protein
MENIDIYSKIDNHFINDMVVATNTMSRIHENYNKDKLQINRNPLELMKESLVSKYLGFDEINNTVHGFDGSRKSRNEIFKKEFLEVKNVRFNGRWRVTFSNTTYRRANNFKRKNVYLALAVWDKLDSIKFIAFGQDVKIGTYLSELVTNYLEKEKRSTGCSAEISFSRLIYKHDFEIYSIDKNVDKLYNILIKRKYLSNLPRSKVHHISQIQ